MEQPRTEQTHIDEQRADDRTTHLRSLSFLNQRVNGFANQKPRNTDEGQKQKDLLDRRLRRIERDRTLRVLSIISRIRHQHHVDQIYSVQFVVDRWTREERSLTDEQRRSSGRVLSFECQPFVEDEDDQIDEDRREEDDLGKEFQEDRVVMSEVSEQIRRSERGSTRGDHGRTCDCQD